MRTEVLDRVRRTAERIAESAGATAEVTFSDGNYVTWNDRALTEKMGPSLRRIAGDLFNPNVQPTTTSEDFADYQRKVPGMFFFLGVTPKGVDPKTAPMNHSPLFSPDERALVPGVRALASLAVDYLVSPLPAKASGPASR
jgi:amidohydrolase